MEKLTSSPVVLVPSTFEYSGDPNMRLGEESEKRVMDAIVKCGHKIPGIKVICFLRPCLIGSNSNSTREVSYCCFITYQHRHYILMAEVKCNIDSRRSNGTRKKAMRRLLHFTQLISDELNVPTDNIQTHAIWPNMEPEEHCSIRCGAKHPSLYEKPKACQQPGTEKKPDPEPPGFHVFKDKFDGDQFSEWIRNIIVDTSKAVDESLYDKILLLVSQNCTGGL